MANESEAMTVLEQIADVTEGIEAAAEILSDDDPESREGRAHEELMNTLAVARQAESRADPRLVTLREAFHQDNYTVQTGDSVMGDYKIEAENGHFGDAHETMRSLGFKHGSFHTNDDGSAHLYVKDARGPSQEVSE